MPVADTGGGIEILIRSVQVMCTPLSSVEQLSTPVFFTAVMPV